MTIEKIYPILTIALSLFPIVGIGHGAAPIGLFEIGAFPSFFSESDYSQSPYERDVYISAGILLIGQIVIISSYFLKAKTRHYVRLLGILTLLVGFYILAFPISDSLRGLAFFTGLPFLLIASISLLFSFNEIRIKKAEV